MKKLKIISITLLMVVFSFATLQASESDITAFKVEPAEVDPALRLEDAIVMAQEKDKKLRMQQTNIELAKVNTEGAKDYYYNFAWDVGFEEASANYSKAMANEKYERKNEEVIKEQIAFDMANQFDDILELEEKYHLAKQNLKIQRQKVNHGIKREQLGLASKASTQAEKAKLETQEKELESLNQAIETEYRKLKDAIGGDQERYNLIKENCYEPLDMKRSLQGQISYAIDSDLGIWLQEEIAKTQEMTFTAPNPGIGGAPTYTLYQQRKLGYEQAMNNISLTKEGKKEQIKQLYENILALEIQYEKMRIDLEETQRQYGILVKRHKLGMVTDLNLKEMELAILQNIAQVNSTIRQHNQLKILFEKSYLNFK